MRKPNPLLVAALAALSWAPSARAAYPDKPVQLIVPYGAGGSTDLLARAMAQVSPKHLPQPLVVVNKAGGAGAPGRVDVMKSPPDGYTLLFGYGSGEDIVVPHQRQVPYDPMKDFDPVCRVSIHSIVLAVNSESPYKTLDDLVKAGKSKGNLTASVAGKGAANDITAQAFGKAAGVSVTTVPGSGGAEAVTRLLGGHADFSTAHPSEVLPHVKAGRLRVLAVALESRDPTLPEVRTFREQGLDVVTAGSVKGLAAPKGTPKDVVATLEKACKAISDDPEFKKILADLGQPVNYMGGEEYRGWIKGASDQYAALLKALNITATAK
jgi:tripartite-type tricarboxylate transporter receptor subunit TctC